MSANTEKKYTRLSQSPGFAKPKKMDVFLTFTHLIHGGTES
jgi:hypothetical protein